MIRVISKRGITFPLSTGQRLMTMVVIFMVALATILAFTLTTVKNLELDGMVVDLAGRQRMLIQRYLSDTMLASHDVETNPLTTANLLLRSLETLRDGGDITLKGYTPEKLVLPPAPTDQIRHLLDTQRSLLLEYFQKTKTLLLEAPHRNPSPDSFLVLTRLQENLQQNADEVVKLFSIHSRKKTLKLLRIAPLIGLVVIILSIILSRQVLLTTRQLEQEIRQRKKVEDERNRFFSLSQDLFCMISTDGKFKMLNPAWETELGFSLEELQGQPLIDFVYSEDKLLTARELAAIQGETYSCQFENRCWCKWGGYKWLLWNMTFSASPGEPLIYASARNMTNRKKYEEELALRDRSMNSATNGILIADARQPDTPTVYCNAAFEKITGYAREEVIGKNCRFLQGTDRHQPGLEAVREAIRNGREARAELRNYKKDGSLFWNELYIAPVRDHHGVLTHFIGIQTDISQRKKQEAELAKKTEELARSNAELQQFAYVASHDLQEPLRMVASYTQLLKKRYAGKLDQDADEFIDYAVDGAMRMQQLIRDLLEYSRVGSETTSFEQTDCEKILQHVLSNLSLPIQNTQAHVTHDPLPTLLANPTLLTQVFQNLIGNAIKFQKRARPTIHIGAKPILNGWEFSVRDHGIGIPQEYLDRIFAIFQRLHSREEYPGTGIGLAICKRIVEKHGGTIWVESEKGQGSTFYFTIRTPTPAGIGEAFPPQRTSTDPHES